MSSTGFHDKSILECILTNAADIIWALMWENLYSVFSKKQRGNNAFVIRILENIISKLATGEISIF